MKKGFWAVALILDFNSPKTPAILHQSYYPVSQVVIYPLAARESETEGSASCSKASEKFLPAAKLAAWADKLKPEPQADRPVVMALKKIQFDLRFGLHSIDQVIVNAPIKSGPTAPANSTVKDSCGENICAALKSLDSTLARTENKIRIQFLSPLSCHLSKKTRIALEVAPSRSALIAAQRSLLPPFGSSTMIASRKQKNPEAVVPVPVVAPVVAESLPLPIPSNELVKAQEADIDSAELGSLNLLGPPFEVQLQPLDSSTLTTTQHLHAPGKVLLPPGKWKLTLVSPSWLAEIPGVVVEMKKNTESTLELDDTFGGQVEWIKATDTDQILVFDGVAGTESKKILIPQGSPPVPVPKVKRWKVFPVDASGA